MMKIILFSAIALFGLSSGTLIKCDNENPYIANYTDMVEPCVNAMKAQVQEELKASIQYLAMGAHFYKDTINRPGFGEMFMKSATEERDHAIKLITYLLMRGQLTKDVSTLIRKNYQPERVSWNDGLDALQNALALEMKVTKMIRSLIQICENSKAFNDYHLVDYLTGEFLEEQYHGERELAGRISTLGKMKDQHGALAEFLYDKKLLD